MLAIQVVVLLALLSVCSFAPGFFFIRRLRWNPLEKLCGAAGLSLILVYLATWCLYCFVPRAGGSIFGCVSLISVGLGIAARRDIRRLLNSSRVRQALRGFVFLLVWSLLLLAMIRIYSGAAWSGDWVEHFQRSLFFLRHFPISVPIFPNYSLPARPPMMNIITAFFLGQIGDRFEFYQIIFLFLNLLMFLPCFLIMPALGGARRSRVLPLAALFAANPVTVENIIYSWTKAFTAFYVVLAIWFYLAGWQKNDPWRQLAAFVALSAGLLAHYSAGPYCLFLGLHYLIVFYRQRECSWRRLAMIAAVSAAFLATWFAWSFAAYGARATLTSNTAWVDPRHPESSKVVEIATNLWDSTMPAVFRNPADMRLIDQRSSEGYLRDRAFLFYQQNLIFSLGIVGGPMVLWLLGRLVTSQEGRHKPEWAFWRAMIPTCVIVGIAVVGEESALGVSHITLLPLTVLGLSFLAANFRSLGRFAALLLIGGCVIDFSLGVFLQVHVESIENAPGKTVFTGLVFEGGQFYFGTVNKNSLSAWAWENWVEKHEYRLEGEWLREFPQQFGNDAGFKEGWPPVRAALVHDLQRDTVYWQGWLDHHGGEFRYLGDSVAEFSPRAPSVIMALVLFLFAGLMGSVLRWRLKQEAQPNLRHLSETPL